MQTQVAPKWPIPEEFVKRMVDGDLTDQFKKFVHYKLFVIVPHYINYLGASEEIYSVEDIFGKLPNTRVSPTINLIFVDSVLSGILFSARQIKRNPDKIDHVLEWIDSEQTDLPLKHNINVFDGIDFDNKHVSDFIDEIEDEEDSFFVQERAYLIMMTMLGNQPAYEYNKWDYVPKNNWGDINIYLQDLEFDQTTMRFMVVPIQFDAIGIGHILTMIIDGEKQTLYFIDSEVSARLDKLINLDTWMPQHLSEHFKNYKKTIVGKTVCLKQLFQDVSGDEFCQTWTLFNIILAIYNHTDIENVIKEIINNIQPHTIKIPDRNSSLSKQVALSTMLLEFMFWIWKIKEMDIIAFYKQHCFLQKAFLPGEKITAFGIKEAVRAIKESCDRWFKDTEAYEYDKHSYDLILTHLNLPTDIAQLTTQSYLQQKFFGGKYTSFGK